MFEKKLTQPDISKQFEALKFSTISNAVSSSEIAVFGNILNTVFNKRALASVCSLNEKGLARIKAILIQDCLVNCNSAEDFARADIYAQKLTKVFDTSDKFSLVLDSQHEGMCKFALHTLLNDKSMPLCSSLAQLLVSQIGEDAKKEIFRSKVVRSRLISQISSIAEDLQKFDKHLFCSKISGVEDGEYHWQVKAEKDFSDIQKRLTEFFEFARIDEIVACTHPGDFFSEAASKKLMDMLELHAQCSSHQVTISGWDFNFIRSYLGFLEDFEILTEARVTYLNNHITSPYGLAYFAFEANDFSLATKLLAFLPREDNLSVLEEEVSEALFRIEPKIYTATDNWIKSVIINYDVKTAESVMSTRQAEDLSLAINHFLKADSFITVPLRKSLFQLAVFTALHDPEPIVKVYSLLKLTPVSQNCKEFKLLSDAMKPDIAEAISSLNRQIETINEFGFRHLSYEQYRGILKLYTAVSFMLLNGGPEGQGKVSDNSPVLLELPEQFYDHKIYADWVIYRSSIDESCDLIVTSTDWLNTYARHKFKISMDYDFIGTDDLLLQSDRVSDHRKIFSQLEELILEKGALAGMVFDNRYKALSKMLLAFSLAYAGKSPFSEESGKAAAQLKIFYKKYNSEFMGLFDKIDTLLSTYMKNPANEVYEAILEIYDSSEFKRWQECFVELPPPVYV